MSLVELEKVTRSMTSPHNKSVCVICQHPQKVTRSMTSPHNKSLCVICQQPEKVTRSMTSPHSKSRKCYLPTARKSK